jgi:hypothetical protein
MPFDIAERLILEQVDGFVGLGWRSHVALADWKLRLTRIYRAVAHDSVVLFGHDEVDHVAMTRMGVVAHQPLRAMVADEDADEVANGIARLAGECGELVVIMKGGYDDELPRDIKRRLEWLVPTGARVRMHLVDERLGALERDFLDLAGAGPEEAGDLLEILDERPLDIDEPL